MPVVPIHYSQFRQECISILHPGSTTPLETRTAVGERKSTQNVRNSLLSFISLLSGTDTFSPRSRSCGPQWTPHLTAKGCLARLSLTACRQMCGRSDLFCGDYYEDSEAKAEAQADHCFGDEEDTSSPGRPGTKTAAEETSNFTPPGSECVESWGSSSRKVCAACLHGLVSLCILFSFLYSLWIFLWLREKGPGGLAPVRKAGVVAGGPGPRPEALLPLAGALNLGFPAGEWTD